MFVASWLPVLVGATTRAAFGWALAVLLALVIGWVARNREPTAMIAGFLASSALVPSGLVTDPTHYMPVAVTGGALALYFARDVRRHGVFPLPPAPIAVTIGLYLAWAALSMHTLVVLSAPIVLLTFALTLGMAMLAGLSSLRPLRNLEPAKLLR